MKRFAVTKVTTGRFGVKQSCASQWLLLKVSDSARFLHRQHCFLGVPSYRCTRKLAQINNICFYFMPFGWKFSIYRRVQSTVTGSSFNVNKNFVHCGESWLYQPWLVIPQPAFLSEAISWQKKATTGTTCAPGATGHLQASPFYDLRLIIVSHQSLPISAFITRRHTFLMSRGRTRCLGKTRRPADEARQWGW